jgi:hypothetical protein
VYDHLTKDVTGKNFQHMHIWKAKTPYKIKIISWLMENNAVLTKDNIIKRKWKGNPTCLFCDQAESLEHLFFQCTIAKCVWGMVGACLGATNVPNSIEQYKEWIRKLLPKGKDVHQFGLSGICWATWKCRNKAVFEKKLIKHQTEIVVHACTYMSYWAGLLTSDFAGSVVEGMKMLLLIAHMILAQQKRTPEIKLLAAPHEDKAGDADE